MTVMKVLRAYNVSASASASILSDDQSREKPKDEEKKKGKKKVTGKEEQDDDMEDADEEITMTKFKKHVEKMARQMRNGPKLSRAGKARLFFACYSSFQEKALH